MKQFKFNLSTMRLDETPVVGGVRATSMLMPGGITSLSALGDAEGTAILWTLLPTCDPLPTNPGPCQPPTKDDPLQGRSHVYAFDAETLVALWDTALSDQLPVMSHHAAPTIADGKLVVANSSPGGITVYELAPMAIAESTSASAKKLTAPYQPVSPPGPPLSAHFKDERSVGELPSLRRDELAPPSDQLLLFRVRVRLDGSGERFDGGRRHGSRWEAADGSKITVKAIKAVPAPDQSAPPWQLFKVTAHDGKGRLDDVDWIQRINTDGEGATYVFYGANKVR